jgi:hypothetical protein
VVDPAQTVAAAVQADLEELGELSRASRSLVASAFALARQLDAGDVSAAAKASCARSLRETMDRLRELAPADAGAGAAGDALDQLRERRESRRAGAAA